MNKTILVIGIIFLLIGVSFNSSSGNCRKKNFIMQRSDYNILYVGGSGPGNYTSIQDAVNDASDGDTIFVYNGIYVENVRIMQKTINLIGEDKNLTIIDANFIEYPILIVSSNYVRINGFTLINPEEPPYNKWESALIKIMNCQNSVIENNIVKQYYLEYNKWNAGIYLINSENNIIRNNIICDTDISSRSVGIMLDNGANLNNISNNEIYNYIDGIRLFSNDNTIYKNNIHDNGRGIEVNSYGEGNEIINNIITANSWNGITLHPGNNTLVSGNIITYNGKGGEFDNGLEIFGDGNYIINNQISNNNPVGIYMWMFPNNFIINNNITFNKQIGLYILESKNNQVSYNNFIDNGNYNAYFEQMIDKCFSVKWNKNYWSDYRGRSFHNIPGRVYFLFAFGVKWFNIDWNPASEPNDIPCSSNFVGCDIN